MRYIDKERQLTDIFIKPLDASHFVALREGLVFAILMAWFEGGACVLSRIFVSFCFFVTFSSYSPKLTLLHLLY
jgi:hypothetical protein